LQGVVDPHIVAGVVGLHPVAVTDAESTVGIDIGQIVAAHGSREGVSLIVVPVPLNMVKPHSGMLDVQYFELMKLIAGIEDELTVVLPRSPLMIQQVRGDIDAGIVFTPVLHDDGVKLFVRIGDGQVVIIDRESHLLMAGIMVDVSIRRGFKPHRHERFYDIKLYFKQSLVVIVFIEDGQAVVATELQLATVVGQAELVVGIEHGGIDGVSIVFYGVVVEAAEPVALEDVLRGAPVGFAVLQMVGEPTNIV